MELKIYNKPIFNNSIKTVFILLLTVFLLIGCKSKPEIIEIAETIEIKEPEFEVISIIILQADIVVTEFETVLKITNPNEFAVELTSLTYELFGNGTSWATGSGSDILHIPAHSSGETRFIFNMNFINMNRRLLDDVIAMRPINYRLRGEAEVQPVIPHIQSFKMSYDRSGVSEVRRRNQSTGR
jgi:LEA14-like dessication related protein